VARALVVGGTGPTGPHVVQGLQDRGHEVTILHRGTHELPELDGIEHIHADPHFREAVEQALDSRAVAQGRLGSLSARATALTVAVGGFVGVHVLPALKYPPNPPGVSNADTVVERSQWYLVMLVISLGVVVGAAVLGPVLGSVSPAAR
jgi:uncharacterized protein YbjT (DUF2867 family)